MTESHTTEQDLVDPFRVAIDFETLSLSPRAAIVGVAAAVFGEVASPPRLLFSAWPIACELDATLEELDAWIDSEASALLSHPASARARTREALGGKGPSLVDAMQDLFVAAHKAAAGRPVVWYSRPSAFDGALLLDLARWSDTIRLSEEPLGQGIPLHRRLRCMRTLQHDASQVSPVKWRKSTAEHDPVADVLADAESAHECLSILRGAADAQRWGSLVEAELRAILEAFGVGHRFKDIGTPDLAPILGHIRSVLRRESRPLATDYD